MKILSWSVRGACQKRFKNQLNVLFKIHNLDIIVLMATKVSSNRGKNIDQLLKRPIFVEILPQGLPGGI